MSDLALALALAEAWWWQLQGLRVTVAMSVPEYGLAPMLEHRELELPAELG